MGDEAAGPIALPDFLNDPGCQLFVEMTTLLPAVAFAKSADGRYVYVNQHYVSTVLDPTYGARPATDYLNRHNRDLGSLPERFDWVEAQESLVMQTGAVAHSDERYSTVQRVQGHAFGVRFPLNTASGVYLGALFIDVTAEEAAIRAAERNQASFRSLFDSSSTAMIALTEAFMIEDANSSACELFQLLSSELRQNSIYDLIHPGDRDRVAGLEAQLSAGPQDRYQTVAAIRRSDGVVLYTRLTRIRRTRIDGGGPTISFATLDVLPPGTQLAVEAQLIAGVTEPECKHHSPTWPAWPTKSNGTASIAGRLSTPPESQRAWTANIVVAETAASMDPTDWQVLVAVASGATNARIAEHVHCSVSNVEYRLRRLRERLGSTNTASMVARAYAGGLLRLDTWPPTPALPVEPQHQG